jgi:hypothetical protein
VSQDDLADAGGMQIDGAADLGAQPHGSTAVAFVDIDHLVIDQGYEVDGMTDLAGQLSDVRVGDGADIDLVELSHPVAIEALSVS